MAEAVIVEAVRTPVGKRNGGLSGVHPADLSAQVLNGLAERTGIDPGIVDDVIWGCVMQVGEQALDIGRTALLTAGWPESVAGVTVDRQCGSSQQSIHFAAAGVVAGHYDAVVAGGVESMSRMPMGASLAGGGNPYPQGFKDRYETTPNQGIGAEMIAEQWGFDRTAVDEFSLGSHEKAAAAQDSGAFDDQIVAIKDQDGNPVLKDEGIRRGTTIEKMATLKPAFKEDGVIHAGNSSQISDGSAALLFMSAEKAKSLGLKPIARVHTATLAGADPVIMLTAPIPATQKALKKSGLRARRHRRVRGQRGVRPGAAGVAEGYRRRREEAQPQRRRDRARPPARRIRRPHHDHDAVPHAGQGNSLRPADDVRGRRPGQRHHPRAAVTAEVTAPPLLPSGGATSWSSRSTGPRRVTPSTARSAPQWATRCSEAQDDPEVRAVVITGAGESFCAGADLKAISRRENLFHPDHGEWGFAGYVHHYIDKPTIAAVNGTALGGGTELAFASDLVVAEERAKFGLPEVKRGSSPPRVACSASSTTCRARWRWS